MLGMKNHFDISDSIEIREVDIAGVACIYVAGTHQNCFTQAIPIGNHTISFCRELGPYL